VASYWLCKKKDKHAWLEPIVDRANRTWQFIVRTGTPPKDTSAIDAGTKTGRGAFRCILSGAALRSADLHAIGTRNEIGDRLLAVVADSRHGRVYLPASEEHEQAARKANPAWQPTTSLGTNARHLTPVAYGYATHAS